MKRIETAIESYCSWNAPWLFSEHVRLQPGLSPEERDFFDQVWSDALDYSNWQSPDLNECCERARRHLQSRFRGLSTAAIDAIIRAASYQWL